MKEFYLVKKKIINNALDIIIISVIISALLRRWDLIFGFLLGGSLSILNFKILASDIHKICSLKIKKESIKIYAFTRYILRYLLSFLILLLALRNPVINIYACLGSLFFIKFSVLWNFSWKYFLGGRIWVSL